MKFLKGLLIQCCMIQINRRRNNDRFTPHKIIRIQSHSLDTDVGKSYYNFITSKMKKA
jgi:hypothetical protein